MKVFVTGATGYIGAAVAEALAEKGHGVAGLARSDGSARTLEDAGHAAVRGDLRSPESLVEPARNADAVIHVAHTGDEDAGAVDRDAVDTLLDAVEGTAKPFVYTSGCWVLGDTGEEVADEEHERDPVDLVRWRGELEPRVLDASGRDIAAVVVRPAIVYGRGGGIPAMLVEEASRRGSVRVVGDGLQEWPMVHVDDLADLYVRALEAAESGTLYNAASGPSYRARDVAVAAALAAGTDAAVEEWPLEDARREMGGFAVALALSQRLSGRKAREELGWSPEAPTLIEELLTGSYREA